MLKKCETIYLYPKGEDTQSLFVIMQELQRQNIVSMNIKFVDDSFCETSLQSLKEEILKNGKLWIVHQDSKLYERLSNNADILNIPYHNGIEELESLMLILLNNIEINKIYENKRDDEFLALTYLAYFVLHFFISLKKDSVFYCSFLNIVEKINNHYAKKFPHFKNSIGITRTTFGNNKHLGNIAEILESKGVDTIYIYGEEEFYLKEKELFGDKCIFIPIFNSYFGCFLSVFRFVVTCLMPHNTPNIGSKYIYVPHAIIDPIASLFQRNRPLDAFFFKRRVGINGYRIISTKSNYKIFEKEVRNLGYEHELICGGYPSLDINLKEYKNYLSTHNLCGGGGNILVSVNSIENLRVVEELLDKFEREFINTKVYFRPYPGRILVQESQKIAEKYQNKDWFIYDSSKKLSVKIMYDCALLLGDYSSLVYTFPLTTLKPAILLVSGMVSPNNCYNGVSFFNSKIHVKANNCDEAIKIIKNIKAQSRTISNKKAKEIAIFREEEVFNLGCASEFIADFIISKIGEDDEC
ncbi:hypothetical protein [Helicobacter sp. WB40]|uniref:hypothetical protein n=1 Tax=Helicobacter sp. WB40 TaxID=3004130 RepID=UPI0022EBC65E|nr:hypothetical protein [Helicobacter sp. WB40]MDA3967592.1 hypothetical protein [Helicobacter sp. WB40]